MVNEYYEMYERCTVCAKLHLHTPRIPRGCNQCVSEPWFLWWPVPWEEWEANE